MVARIWMHTAVSVLLSGVCAHAFETTGNEFQANAYTTDYQGDVAVAGLSDGGFVVVWQSGSYTAAPDGGYAGIFGRRFTGDGSAAGTEFQVNAYTTDFQTSPSVAPLSDGGFVVAWQSFGQDGDLYGIFARRFTSAGDPAGGELQVNSYTTSGQYQPSVASTPGGFVVAWDSFEQDGDLNGVFARRFDASGTPIAGEFEVNTFTDGRQHTPDVTVDAEGNIVVAWESEPEEGDVAQDGSDAGIAARRFDASGAPLGTDFVVNNYTTDRQVNPAVVHTSDGGFIVIWESRKDLGEVDVDDEVSARVFDAAGTALADEFVVNQYTTGSQEAPDIARTADGDLLVVWESINGVGATDTTSEGVFARRLNAIGEPLGAEFQVNSFVADDQEDARVAGLSAGGFAAVWESALQDGSESGVYGQAFADELCGDATEDDRYTASDALLVLRTAVGSASCPVCICDVNTSGATNATDALVVLRVAVGQAIALVCTTC